MRVAYQKQATISVGDFFNTFDKLKIKNQADYIAAQNSFTIF